MPGQFRSEDSKAEDSKPEPSDPERHKFELNSPHLTLVPDDDATVRAVFKEDSTNPDEYFPQPHLLAEAGSYHFSQWSHSAEPGSYPEHMAFVYMDQIEPGLDSEPAGFTYGAYDLDSRTRITGLDESGFAFINTSNLDGNPGYPGRRLGGALLALDTRNINLLETEFTAGTVLPNSRVYHLRLQYRLGDHGPFLDVTDEAGNPVEYHRNKMAGHAQTLGPVTLPEEILDKPYVQLLWRYFYTGMQLDDDSGQRTKLNVSDIRVTTGLSENGDNRTKPDEPVLLQNYPNPFNQSTVIRYELPDQDDVRLEIFDALGRKVSVLVDETKSQGAHQITWVAGGKASGLYVYRLRVGDVIQTRSMTLIR